MGADAPSFPPLTPALVGLATAAAALVATFSALIGSVAFFSVRGVGCTPKQGDAERRAQCIPTGTRRTE
jgi:hypothetical protein